MGELGCGDGERGWSVGRLYGMIPIHGGAAATATATTNTQQLFYPAAGLRRTRQTRVPAKYSTRAVP